MEEIVHRRRTAEVGILLVSVPLGRRRPEVRMSLGYRTMKPRETALRFKRFEADEHARKVSDLEQMIREFEAIASDLDRQIHAEEERTGVRDPAHFAYSTFAKSAAQRRDNLRASADELKVKLEVAAREKDAAHDQLARVAMNDSRDSGDRNKSRGSDRSPGATLR